MRKQNLCRRTVILLCAGALSASLALSGCGSDQTAEPDSKAVSAEEAQNSNADASAGTASTDEGAGSADISDAGTEDTVEAFSETAEEDGSFSAASFGQLKSFSAETLAGGVFTEKNLEVKDATMINFWSITCGPCIDEMPEITKFEKALPDNVQLVTVYLDGRDYKDDAASFLDSLGFEGTTLISGTDDLLDVVRNIQFTPTTLVADSAGNLRGDAIIGAPQDLFRVYQDAVNAVLREDGKEEISVHEE